jgi:hypothetical protein
MSSLTRGSMNDSGIQLPDFYEIVADSEIAANEVTELERLPDPDGETTLPFTPLGGPWFEILTYYLLSGDPLNPQAKVILVKSTGDQGRDVLVYVDAKLQTIVQCKNLSTPLDKPRLLRELVKLALHDLMTPFIPDSGVKYEIWAPGGLYQPAEQLLAVWQTQLTEDDVQTAFHAVTNEYEKLKEFKWDDAKERLLTTLRTKIEPWRQLNLDVARRVRNNHDLYVRYFAVTSVMPATQVEAYFRQRDAKEESTRSEMLSLTTRTNETLSTIQENLSNIPHREVTSDIDRDNGRAGTGKPRKSNLAGAELDFCEAIQQ